MTSASDLASLTGFDREGIIAALLREHGEHRPAARARLESRLTVALGKHFHQHPGDETPELLAWYFALLRFQGIAELHGPHSICERRLDEAAREPTICVRNVVRAPLLQARWAAAHSATLFSATLSPSAHYVDMLGLPQVNEVNEQFRRRIDANLGRGYEHTYLYPGVRKVVQAAGRQHCGAPAINAPLRSPPAPGASSPPPRP